MSRVEVQKSCSVVDWTRLHISIYHVDETAWMCELLATCSRLRGIVSIIAWISDW